MSVSTRPLPTLDASFARQLDALSVPWRAAAAPAPRLLALNAGLASELGLDVEVLRSPAGVDVLVGSVPPPGAVPVAQAYAGHQFGGYSPRLGDGRALLLGELIDVEGRRRDLHLKGSGRTPFARGGDGKAAVGPMLREYLMGEAMHALGIPTTRALAVVATGESIHRETTLPGAVLVRVAASHLRVGTFQYAASLDDVDLVRRLADYAIARHYPDVAAADDPYQAFLEAVIEAQARLLARWMGVGFIHGVMNTDNMAISGETIDYGPCAFMEAYDPATVFSSIDHAGRYAYGNQPVVAQWNLARLAETLLPLLRDEREPARDVAIAALASFPARYESHWRRELAAKLGLTGLDSGDEALGDDLLALLHVQGIDFTGFFRSLSASLLGDDQAARSISTDPAAFDAWAARWKARLPSTPEGLRGAAHAMDRVNPVYIPRNHHVEAALEAATAGDLDPFRDLVEVLSQPYDERPGLDAYAAGAPASFGAYRTFCGT